MMVNPKTIVFVLELVGVLTLSASSVIVKHYLPTPKV